MAGETLAAQLTRVQEAIAKIEQYGQSISDEGQTINRANLPALYAREKQLIRRINHESTQSRTVAEF